MIGDSGLNNIGIPRIPRMIALSAKIFNNNIPLKVSRSDLHVVKKARISTSLYTPDYKTANYVYEDAHESKLTRTESSDSLHSSQNYDQSPQQENCPEYAMPPRSESPRDFNAAILEDKAESSELEDESRRENLECKFCCKLFSKRKKLSRHEKRHHRRGSFMCKTCYKILASYPSWSYHKKVHDNDKPFSCDSCPKRFVTNSHLQLHIKAHKHVCHFCQQKFTARCKLREHMKIHKVHKCNQCSMSFFRLSRLHRHQDLNHKRHECEYCGKTFETWGKLEWHQKVTGEGLYICAHCLEICEDNLSFRRHLLVHEKKKILVCTLCNETFNSDESLEDHFKTHDDIDI